MTWLLTLPLALLSVDLVGCLLVQGVLLALNSFASAWEQPRPAAHRRAELATTS